MTGYPKARRWWPWQEWHRHPWGPVYLHLGRWCQSCSRCGKVRRVAGPARSDR